MKKKLTRAMAIALLTVMLIPAFAVLPVNNHVAPENTSLASVRLTSFLPSLKFPSSFSHDDNTIVENINIIK